MQAQAIWLTSIPRAKAKALASKKPILMDVYAPWCPYCRRMQSQVYPDRDVRALGDRFVRLRINGEKHPDIMNRYRIQGFPSMVFLDSEGGLLGVARGFHNKERMLRRMRGILKKIERQNRILKELEGSPESAFWNYRAGLYYYRTGSLDKARSHFRTAARHSTVQPDPNVRNALYNLAVVSMDQKDYRQAAQHWTRYLRKYPKQKPDAIYARYYRGISFYFLSDKKQARSDLTFAVRYLPKESDRSGARRLMQALD